MNELFMQHVIMAGVLSVLTATGIETVKSRLKSNGIELNGSRVFIVSILVSLIVSFGYTMFYENMVIKDAIAVYVIVVLGAQGFYQTIIDKGDK